MKTLSKVASNITPQNLQYFFCEQKAVTPKIFSNNKSVISLSQWWNGKYPQPIDYYVQDTF